MTLILINLLPITLMLFISDCSLGDQKENENSLPAHFLFDSNKDEYLTQESPAGDYTGIESCDVLKRNGFHKLLKAKACHKLCLFCLSKDFLLLRLHEFQIYC